MSRFPEPGYVRIQGWIDSVLTLDDDACIVWPFARNKSGYGKLTHQRKSYTAHRFICILVHGEPPSSVHQAAHSCNNGHLGCVNPRHLRWATPKENCADTQAGKNHDRGENNPAAKLTEDDVVSIRHLCASGVSQSATARMFNVASETVFGIYRGGRWPHVTRNHTVIQPVVVASVG